MSRKHGFLEIRDLFENNGFIVLDMYDENICGKTKINVQDFNGYKYALSEFQFTMAKENNKNFVPDRFAKFNPHTIDNIKLWISENNKSYYFDHGEYLGSNLDNLYFKCRVCNRIWNTQWGILIMGGECPYCNKKRFDYENSLAKARPDLLEEWDYSKNGDLCPENVAPRSSKMIWWKCKECGHEWKANPSNRNHNNILKRTNCPKCRQSMFEVFVEKYLKEKYINYQKEIKFENCAYVHKLVFDFYLPDYNLCIEAQGRQHYLPIDFSGKGIEDAKKELEKQKVKDDIKRKYCNDNGIKLLEIPYWEANNVNKFLENKLF